MRRYHTPLLYLTTILSAKLPTLISILIGKFASSLSLKCEYICVSANVIHFIDVNVNLIFVNLYEEIVMNKTGKMISKL